MPDFPSQRFARECLSSGGFNGNHSEFLRGVIYDTGINLGLRAISIGQSNTHLDYTLLSDEVLVASFRFGVFAGDDPGIDLIRLDAKPPYSKEQITSALEKAISALDSKVD